MAPTFFSKNLVYLRELRKVNQAKLAQIVGKKQNTISNWEAGRNEPDYQSLDKIITFFDISVQDFLYTDLEKGNLIVENKSKQKREKGNLKGNPTGNLNPEIGVEEDGLQYVNKDDSDDLHALVDTLEKLVKSKDEIIVLLKNKISDLESGAKRSENSTVTSK